MTFFFHEGRVCQVRLRAQKIQYLPLSPYSRHLRLDINIVASILQFTATVSSNGISPLAMS